MTDIHRHWHIQAILDLTPDRWRPRWPRRWNRSSVIDLIDGVQSALSVSHSIPVALHWLVGDYHKFTWWNSRWPVTGVDSIKHSYLTCPTVIWPTDTVVPFGGDPLVHLLMAWPLIPYDSFSIGLFHCYCYCCWYSIPLLMPKRSTDRPVILILDVGILMMLLLFSFIQYSSDAVFWPIDWPYDLTDTFDTACHSFDSCCVTPKHSARRIDIQLAALDWPEIVQFVLMTVDTRALMKFVPTLIIDDRRRYSFSGSHWPRWLICWSTLMIWSSRPVTIQSSPSKPFGRWPKWYSLPGGDTAYPGIYCAIVYIRWCYRYDTNRYDVIHLMMTFWPMTGWWLIRWRPHDCSPVEALEPSSVSIFSETYSRAWP